MDTTKPIAYLRYLTKEFRAMFSCSVLGTVLPPISFAVAVGFLVWSVYVSYTGIKPNAWLVGVLQMGGMLSLMHHHPMRGLYEMFFLGEFRGRAVYTATAKVVSLHETTNGDELHRLVDTKIWPYDAVCNFGERYAIIQFVHEGSSHIVCLRTSKRLHATLKVGSELPVGFQTSRDPFLKVSNRVKVKAFPLQ